MEWNLNFISEADFINHVAATIEKYGEKLESFDIKRFNHNIIDPIKMIFDKTVYQTSWEEMIGNEIFRQRDKANNNDIGYFHQRIFQYIKNCTVPDNGTEGGWDVIYRNEDGNVLPDGAYGELVITTIGLEAMPLIRYRTGDYTRILPPCPCGGVTKRIDTVSRREGEISMEALDSALFRIPELVDCRAAFDGKLHLHCLCRNRIPDRIADTVREVYPLLEVEVTTELAAGSHRPLYPGKRYVR